MNLKLKEKIRESLSAVLPITGIVLMISIFLIPMELGSVVMFLTGAVMLIVGMGFFQLGAEMAMTPNGANNLILRILAQNTGKEVLNIGGKEENSMSETKYSLVAAIVNRGFSGDVMETVRGAGAKGGTVIHSRRIGNEDVTNFWGLSVQDEKEIVLILTESANKVALMKCIGESCGMHSEAQGIVMSMPIDSVAGI